MSQAISPSAGKSYGIGRVCRVWRLPRATRHRWKAGDGAPPLHSAKRGPKSGVCDGTVLGEIRALLAASLFVGEGHREDWAELRHRRGAKVSARRVFRLMREHGILALGRSTAVLGPATHNDTIITQCPDEMWAIDATACMIEERNATAFIRIYHGTGERLGVRASLRGDCFDAIECVRKATWATNRHKDVGIATRVSLRHDHGSQFISHASQGELRTTGIASSPSFVRQPEGNGCAERFIRTLKEQLLGRRHFGSVEELSRALHGFAHRFNNYWTIGRRGYRTPPQHKRNFLVEAA